MFIAGGVSGTRSKGVSNAAWSRSWPGTVSIRFTASALTDQSGAVTFANRAMESICGSTGDDQVLAGQTLEKALELQLQPEEVRTQFSAAAGSRTAVAQIKRSIAGSTQVLRVARHPLRAGDARSAGHLWAVRDVT